MPEYRRFIAYFYEYIDGKKQKNAGFAKVELRNGMWRILFRLNTETEPLRPVRAYGFVREQGWQLGLYMGSMRPGVVRMEEWAYRADIPVWQGKYGFASLAGIWIQSEDGRRYVTVWDDEPVFTDRFVLALPKEAVNTENKEEKSEQVTERETESIHEKQTEENSDEKNETERQIHAAEISEAWEKEKDSVADEDQAEMVDAEDTDNLGGNAEAMPEEHISEDDIRRSAGAGGAACMPVIRAGTGACDAFCQPPGAGAFPGYRIFGVCAASSMRFGALTAGKLSGGQKYLPAAWTLPVPSSAARKRSGRTLHPRCSGCRQCTGAVHGRNVCI